VLCRDDSQLQSSIEYLGSHKILTKAFVVGSSPSLGFFAVPPLLLCAFLATLEFIPATGRQYKQYAI
jgi:hypothetical protein